MTGQDVLARADGLDALCALRPNPRLESVGTVHSPMLFPLAPRQESVLWAHNSTVTDWWTFRGCSLSGIPTYFLRDIYLFFFFNSERYHFSGRSWWEVVVFFTQLVHLAAKCLSEFQDSFSPWVNWGLKRRGPPPPGPDAHCCVALFGRFFLKLDPKTCVCAHLHSECIMDIFIFVLSLATF